MKKLFLSAMLLGVTAANAQVVINEIMQSNIDCVMDDLNDFPDSWVEVFNAGSEAQDLAAFKLGITKAEADAWQFPACTLGPGEYALVYCDKAFDDWQTYRAPQKRDKQNWHTPFRLESGKNCAVFLFKNGEIVDQLESGLKKQPAPNVAYGRKEDGGEKWGYQAVPTPRAKNCGTVYGVKDVLGQPVFSVAGKVFTKNEKIKLALSLPEDAPEGTVIRYTTDCSEPTAESKLYEGELSFNGTTIVKARLFCDGKLSPWSTTQSYIKIDHDVTLPVVSISTDSRYLYDDQIGIYTDGTYTYVKPTGGGWWGGGGGGGKDEDKNFFYNWRRPMNIEYFEGEGVESAINQLGEMRIGGAYTRRNSLKTLTIYANKRFGENKRLSYEFFPDQRPGKTDFKSILLRNAGNDFDGLYMRDAIIQCSMAKYLDLDWQAWSPVIIVINGEYKGMLNIRERSNEDNIYTNYNGLEDIDMVENWNELKEGTIDNWQAFQAFYSETGHSYEEYDKLLDVQEFMDVMIFNAFFCNTDFPGNNVVFWRPQTETGRWRMLVKDTDFGLGLYGKSVSTNFYHWLYNPSNQNTDANKEPHTRLFRRLMDDETFKREFIDRTAIYMGDFMNHDRIMETWEPMYDKVVYEYKFHRALINAWWPNFSDEHKNAKIWLRDRTKNVYDHLNSYFKAGTPRALTINKGMSEEELAKIAVRFNGWKLSRGTFDGKFFQKREIKLEGEGVTGWKIVHGSTEQVIEGSSCTINMPTSATTITALTSSADGIDEVTTGGATVTDVFDPAGVRRNGLQKGLNIVRTSDGKSKAIWNHDK